MKPYLGFIQKIMDTKPYLGFIQYIIKYETLPGVYTKDNGYENVRLQIPTRGLYIILDATILRLFGLYNDYGWKRIACG